MNRTVVAVAGAGDLSTAVLAAAQRGSRLDAAAAELAAGAHRLDLTEAVAASRADGRSVVVHHEPGGGLVAVRWFEPGRPTPVHDHGTWGVALQVEGASRYERWTQQAGGARVVDVRERRAGDTMTWRAPPDDAHRQEAIGGSCSELIVLGDRARAVEVAPATSLLDLAAQRLVAGATLSGLYADGAILDVNVPAWRYQVGGARSIDRALLEHAASMTGARVATARADYGDTHVVVELDVRFSHDGEDALSRELHLVRVDAGAVAVHAIYCTGVWDAATIARQRREAPMVQW